MGPKVTIDSATLVNKAYEVVETHWLYGLPYDRIEVVLHPESVVHAMVELEDGSVVASIAEPDMRLPIQYALLWEHQPSPARRFDWTHARTLHFGAVELERYPCYSYVLAVARPTDQGSMVGLAAADEGTGARVLAGAVEVTDLAGPRSAGSCQSSARTTPRSASRGPSTRARSHRRRGGRRPSSSPRVCS